MNLLFVVIALEVSFAIWWIIEEILHRKKKREFHIGMQLIPIIAWIITELLC